MDRTSAGRQLLLAILPLLLACERPAQEVPSRAALARILSKQRIVEPRLTGGSAYAPCRQEPKPGAIVALPRCSQVPRKELVQLLGSLRRPPAIRGREAGGTEPEKLRDQAMAYLMVGTDSSAQMAVANLEEAARQRPRDATLHSDLAAARIVLAGVLGEPYELVRSLDASEQALSLAPDLAAALFNRALALERLFLANEARAAWQRYLKVDSSSPWGQEAEWHARSLASRPWDEEWKQRRAELEAAALRADQGRVDTLVDAYRQPAREAAQEDWLPAWADAWLQGREEEAQRPLRIARAVGEALARKSGDAMVQDAVAAIEAADSRSRRQLAEGHRAYRAGRALYMSMSFNQSEPFLREASQLLRRGGSPMADWADLFTAVCVQYHSDYDGTRDLLEDLRRRPRLERYPALEGRILYNLGIIRTVQADFSGGLAAYTRARSLCSRTGEIENLAAVRHVLAESLGLLGQTGEAWKQRYLALSALNQIPSSVRRTSLLFEATEACLQESHPACALALQSETIPSVDRWGGGVSMPQALLKRSRTALALGRSADAERDLAEAEKRAGVMADPDVQEDLRAEILSIRSRLLASQDPRSAEADISEALGYYERTGARLSLVAARQERARLHLALGDFAGAETDLRAGIEEYEAQRAGLARDSERVSFFEQSRDLFDEMVALQVQLGKKDEALSYAERSRARALLDQVSILPSSLVDSAGLLATEAPPLPAAELRRLLHPRVAVIEYHWIGRRLFTWVVTTDGIAFRELPIDPADLAKSVERFLAALKRRGRDRAVREQAEHLFDLLIAPIEAQLEGRQRLVFVPDGLLFGLPFAALAERGSSRYLVEDYELVVAPSATVYLRCSERDRLSSRASQLQVLAVGNPTIAPALVPVGGELPAAETEAVQLARLYPRSVLLTAGEATASRFLSRIDESDVVHFAGHAHVNETYPLLSALLLAPEAGREGSGPLFAHQIYGRRFPRTRVVVLAACSTGRGAPRFAEEAIGLARPFLAAGVPAVVASLSAVEDAATLQLTTAFHRHFLESRNPIAAFHKAQRERIGSASAEGLPPWSWASFEVFGGSGFSD